MTSLRQRWLIGLLSAPLAALVFPPFGPGGWGIPWLAPLAWLPLFYSLHGAGSRESFYRGLAHGFIFYAITLSWLFQLFSTFSIILWLLLALFSAGACLGIARLLNRPAPLHPLLTALCGATLWTGLEFLRGEVWWLKFPWMSAGIGLGPMPWHPWLGVYFSSFLLVFALLCWITRETKNSFVTRLSGLFLILFLLACVRSGVPRFEAERDGPIRVAAVQDEWPPPLSPSGEPADEGLRGNDFIVWPEYSRPLDVRTDRAEWAPLRDYSGKLDTILILGTRTDTAGGWYNTALSLKGDQVLGEHYKNHPVHFFNDGTPGTEALPVVTPYGRVGTSICFDNDYQDTARAMTASGAEFFLVPSLDAVSWTLREHLQHAEFARHRAAENGREFVIASGAGITQHIDADGQRLAVLPQPQPGVLQTSVTPHQELTFFTRYGWLFGWLTLAGSGIIAPLLLRESQRHTKRLKNER